MMKIYTVAFFVHRYIDNILMVKERLRIKSKSFFKNMSTLILVLPYPTSEYISPFLLLFFYYYQKKMSGFICYF